MQKKKNKLKSTFDKFSFRKQTKTQKLYEATINSKEELTSEVNIDSLDIFNQSLEDTDDDEESSLKKRRVNKKNKSSFSNIEIDEEVNPAIHSHLQSINNAKNRILVDPITAAKKEAEKIRLNKIKEKILSKRGFDANKPISIKDAITKEDRIKKLFDLGYISPTKGKIPSEEELKQKELTEIDESLNEGTFELNPVSQEIISKEEKINEENLTKEQEVVFFKKREKTIEQILAQAFVVDRGELEYISLDLLDDLLKNNITYDEVTKEITRELKALELEDPIELEKKVKPKKVEERKKLVKKEIKIEPINQPEEKPKDWCRGYRVPGLDLLNASKKDNSKDSPLRAEAQMKAEKLDELFKNFNIGAKVVKFEIGPTVTTFEIEVESGTKVTKITKLEDNIKMELLAKDIRIQAPIPGKSYVGIEIPNDQRKMIEFSEVMNQAKNIKSELLIVLGQDTVGNVLTFDLAKAPHMLIAGSTGSGKSVAINTIIVSLLLKYTPEQVKMILVDPKMVEFTPFHNIPHLITPVITSAPDANLALKQAVNEMEKRYKLMAENGARNIIELNNKRKEKVPYLVVIIDELADLMMVASKEVEESIMRITQKARAAGIHMIVATQRPSTDIITGVIKTNIPSRIAFTVASSIDSRTILDKTGAEKLVGMGDMLLSLYGQLPIRGQGAYISTEEVDNITKFSKDQCKPFYEIEIKADEIVPGGSGPLIDENDPLYVSAKRVVIQQGKASTSMIQRYLSIGYNKAANIIESLEANGIIGPANGSKPREILVDDE